MKAAVFNKLLSINREFYTNHAQDFSTTRCSPQPGYTRLAQLLPNPCHTLLDVGCGNGRLGRFLLEQGSTANYTGVDSSPLLLAIAAEMTWGNFYQRELSDPECLDGLGLFDAICCLATLHHIPDIGRRTDLVGEFVKHLAEGGLIILSTWQFLESSRQMKKVVDWSEASIGKADLDQNDYLMTWGGKKSALRYVAYIDLNEIQSYAEKTGLSVIDHYRSDGQEGDLNLYVVLTR